MVNLITYFSGNAQKGKRTHCWLKTNDTEK